MDIDISNICNRRIESSSDEEEEEEMDSNIGLNELAQEIQKIQVRNHAKKEIFEDFEELFETHSVKYECEDSPFEYDINSKPKNPIGSEVIDKGLKRGNTKKVKTMNNPSFNDMSIIQSKPNNWKNPNK
jgi:hypothetical protein